MSHSDHEELIASYDEERFARAKARVGECICGKWTLDELLGSGGMAAVYAATHRNGRRCAIKIMHQEHAMLSEVRSRFLKEGYAANRVNHPGVAAVLDDGVAEDGSLFLVMELLQGETLENRLRRHLLTPVETLDLADQVLDILAAAHEQGVIHRDIKPDNVFISTDGRIRLLDFGIARCQGPSRTTTQNGAALGTPAFMSPEQARGNFELTDARSDLWSLGATLFQCVSGHLVREAKSVNEELLLAMTEPSRSLAELAPELPASLISLIDRTIAFERDERWSDAREMQLAVREVRARFQFNHSLDAPISPSSRNRVDLLADTIAARPVERSRRSLPPRSRRALRRTIAGTSVAALGIATVLGGNQLAGFAHNQSSTASVAQVTEAEASSLIRAEPAAKGKGPLATPDASQPQPLEPKKAFDLEPAPLTSGTAAAARSAAAPSGYRPLQLEPQRYLSFPKGPSPKPLVEPTTSDEDPRVLNARSSKKSKTLVPAERPALLSRKRTKTSRPADPLSKRK